MECWTLLGGKNKGLFQSCPLQAVKKSKPWLWINHWVRGRVFQKGAVYRGQKPSLLFDRHYCGYIKILNLFEMREHFKMLVLLLPVLVFTGCGQEVGEFVEDRRIIQILQENQNFSILVEALERADLSEELASDGPFTLFAPTNGAMENYFSAQGISGDDWMNLPESRDVLLYHVMAGELRTSQMPNAAMETLLPNENITFQVEGNSITLNDTANIVTPDVEASNGIIHGIDQLMMPPRDGHP
jgi:uncharacterized surface protein with fasciclin (FAS1) repeats